MQRIRTVMLMLVISFASAGVVLLTGCTGQRVEQTAVAPELRIHVPRTGNLLIADHPVALSGLRDHLKAQLEAGAILPESKVLVVGEADAPWERLREAYGQVLAAGLRDAKIARQPSTGSQQP